MRLSEVPGVDRSRGVFETLSNPHATRPIYTRHFW